MYAYLDRPIATLDNGSKILVWAMRQWTAAVEKRSCPVAALGKSLADFSQTGPQLRHEVLRHFRLYSALALMRLTLIAFGILFVQGLL